VKPQIINPLTPCSAIFLTLFLPLSFFSQNLDSIAKKLPSLSGREKVQALSDLCYYTSSGNINQSIIYGNQAVELARQLNDSLVLAGCENDLAMAYFYKGSFDSCIFLSETAYKIRLAKNKWRDAGASLSKSALAYYEKGIYSTSLEKNLEAIRLFRKAGASAELANLQNNIGSVYERNNQLNEALKIYNEAAEACLKAKDFCGFVLSKSNCGNILRKQKKIKESISLYDSLIPLCRKYCREEFISQIYQSMGVSERAAGDTKKGLEYYLKAKDIYEKVSSLTGLSIININIGNCYTDLKQYAEAENFLQMGLKQSQQIESLLWQKIAYEGLYKLESKKGDFKKANVYLESYSHIKDSIYNDETHDKLNKLQTLYNFEQKENTILVQKNQITEAQLALNKRNTYLIILIAATLILSLSVIFIVQRANIRRKKSEIAFQKNLQRERRRIAKDLHDNMGAELTIISSAIDIKSHSIEKEQDKADLETISDQVRKASHLMRDTIWTVSEEKISLANLGLKIKEFADRTFKGKHITIHFKNTDSEADLKPESTLNFFRIAQEIITNASKHSQAKNFYIDSFASQPLTLSFMDDGKGLDPETVTKGYGLENIKNRARETGATVHLQSEKGEFTKITLTINSDSIHK
jgi:signal transduction histidine kinase